MSRTRNANSILVGTTSEETVGARKAAQVLAATIFAALFAVPVASAVDYDAARAASSTTVATCVNSAAAEQRTHTGRPIRARSAAGAPRRAPDLRSRLLRPHLDSFACEGEGEDEDEHPPQAHGSQDRCQPDGRIREQGAAGVLDPLMTPGGVAA